MIDRFSKAEFEAALPSNARGSLWTRAGLVQGEETYHIPVTDTNKRIVIRSSIDATGYAAETGADSIRLWVEYEFAGGWRPLAKVDAWTTRIPGWQTRLTEKARELWKIALDDSRRGPAKDDAPANTDTPSCPNCSAPMVKRTRRSDGSKFWGCSTFPNCRGSRSYDPAPTTEPAPEPKREFIPSTYQAKIADAWLAGTGNIVVIARPGSGKTSTLEWLTKQMPADGSLSIALVAFNTKIADELSARIKPINPAAHVSTFHSLGYSNIRAVMGKVKVNNYKIRDLARATAERIADNFDELSDIEANLPAIVKLIGLLKATLLPPTPANLDAIALTYNIELNGSHDIIIKAAAAIYALSIADYSTIDYDDMIYACASGQIPCAKFDRLMVDETQDLNAAQIEFIKRSLAPGGLCLAVGDPHQSIYAFRGADADAVEKVIAGLNARQMPLSISYRLPLSHIEMINNQFPDGQIEAAPNARRGSISQINESALSSTLREGDLVLCRTNAPMVKHVFACIRDGKKATILGREIGQDLISFIKRVQKKTKSRDLTELFTNMNAYVRKEAAKLTAADRELQAANLVDKHEVIIALSDGCDTIAQVCDNIDRVFTNERAPITFSTIHKAKGGEADRVFILKPELMPHPKASTPQQRQQEEFISYVALSRSKNDLIVCISEAK